MKSLMGWVIGWGRGMGWGDGTGMEDGGEIVNKEMCWFHPIHDYNKCCHIMEVVMTTLIIFVRMKKRSMNLLLENKSWMYK